MADRRHWYVELNHGALLVFASSKEEALEIAFPNADTDEFDAAELESVRQGISRCEPLPDIAQVEDDQGFQWRNLPCREG
jgi:hypothetical protein